MINRLVGFIVTKGGINDFRRNGNNMSASERGVLNIEDGTNTTNNNLSLRVVTKERQCLAGNDAWIKIVRFEQALFEGGLTLGGKF